jgi:protocatechuate 3,4-dioxygenase beta subunit
MNVLLRAALLFGWCCTLSLCVVRAQAGAGGEAKPTGMITGRVTIGEKGAGGVAITLLSQDAPMRRKAFSRATTDAEGRYTLSNVPTGRYSVLPVAPAYVVTDIANIWPPGKAVNIVSGETVEDINFEIKRGGVITGRVADADGRPIIAQAVQVERVDPQPGALSRLPSRPGADMTDDRGVYRIYGLPEGRYRVSVGQDSRGSAYFGNGMRTIYTRTFYPNGTQERDARIVEVTAGGENEGIDITISGPVKTYKVSGRVVDADTGQPIPRINVFYGSLREGSQAWMDGVNGGGPVNLRGEFQMTAMKGRYGLTVAPNDDNEWYSEMLTFEVADADVNGLELKLRRGSSLIGVLIVEGSADRSAVARVKQLQVYAHSISPNSETNTPFSQSAHINPDRTFFIKGLRPGKVQISINGWSPQQKGFSLLRIERNGVEQREGIEVGAGEQVSGVRIVVAYGNAIIRGQVRIDNGPLPEGTRMVVSARRVGGAGGSGTGNGMPFNGRPSEVDARGHFIIEGMAAGEYELTLRVFGPNFQGRRQHEVKQMITVGDIGEIPVTLVYVNEPETKP